MRDAEVLAPLELATTRRARPGLLGRDGIEGALLLRPARSVHTVGMPSPSTWPTAAWRATRSRCCGWRRCVRRRRAGLAGRRGPRAAAGALGTWGVSTGDRLDVRPEIEST
ncbi:MAG: DUF192 domain-containing protein [Acidimicrobiales bacterium]